MTDLPVDLTNLRNSIGDDKELEKELFDEFASSSADIINELAGLSSTGSSGNDAWRKASHALKGTAANLGAVKLAALCKQAQEKFESDAPEKSALLEAIRAERELVVAFLSTQA